VIKYSLYNKSVEKKSKWLVFMNIILFNRHYFNLVHMNYFFYQIILHEYFSSQEHDKFGHFSFHVILCSTLFLKMFTEIFTLQYFLQLKEIKHGLISIAIDTIFYIFLFDKFFYCCAGCGYTVAFIKVLMYQLYHSWIYPLHCFIFPSPIPEVVSAVTIFAFAYMYMHHLYPIHPPTTLLTTSPLLDFVEGWIA
jgi:hypothetical protein